MAIRLSSSTRPEVDPLAGMAADEIRAELKRLRDENAKLKLKAARPSYDWVLWVIAFVVLAAMLAS